MRVAVSQFATSFNVQDNLATCIRMINKAAECKPTLIVLPEYCNTHFFSHPLCNTTSFYVDHEQAWNEALSIDGDFLKRISEQATKHDCYIVINVTLRRDLSRDLLNNKQDDTTQATAKSNISVTTCLFSPLGKLIHQVDKHALTGHESDFFISASQAYETVTTPIGKLGLLMGNDDMTFKASRELALGGAQLLCHSMNSFALDQSRLHGPTRACENKVFLAAANKVGSLIPEELIPAEHIAEKHISSEHTFQEKTATFSAQSAIPKEYLVGAGQSQIVSPDGKVLAKIDNNKEGYVFADIELPSVVDLAECDVSNGNNKLRPDGTNIIEQRRPELYQALTLLSKQATMREVTDQDVTNLEGTNLEEINKVPVTANVVIFATYKSNEEAIDDVCFYIENNLSDIIQLPELFFIADKKITHNTQQRSEIARFSEQLISQISAELRPFQYVCTSLVIEGKHQSVLISEQGLFATQQQLHFCKRYQWTALGDNLNIIELPLEQGNVTLAMLTADDANIPELVNVAALNGIHLLLVPFDIQEPCEAEYSLLSRAAENRICIVAATREKSFANHFPTSNVPTNNVSIKNSNQSSTNKKKVKTQKSTGLIANLTTNSALLSQWKSRKFDGFINQPLVKHQQGKITKAVIHPIAACSK